MLKEIILDKPVLHLYNRVAYSGKVLLLEHQWLMNAFIQHIFGIDNTIIPTIANDHNHPDGKTRSIRPDLIVMHKVETAGDIYESAAMVAYEKSLKMNVKFDGPSTSLM